jgi:DNA polymerase III delta subunit
LKFYEFVDRAPAIGTLAFVEGTERELADRAVATIVDRLLPPEARDFNLQRFDADTLDDFRPIGEAVQAMPFLGERRVVIVNGAHLLKVDPRRELLAIAQGVPDGNTLVIVDLVAPTAKKVTPIAAGAGKHALRIDTTAPAAKGRSAAPSDVRKRFVTELLDELGVTAEARVVNELSRSEFDLWSIRNDLEKLAVTQRHITYAAFVRESLSVEDPKTYEFATAAVEGRASDALSVVAECFDDNPRAAAIPLLSALARECSTVWELARPNGRLPAGVKDWREPKLRATAARMGQQRARLAFEMAVGAFESIVTGKAGGDPDEYRTLIERITIALADRIKQPRVGPAPRGRGI